MIKKLKDAGVPIHGIGLQGHLAVKEPSVGQLDSTISQLAELGLPLQITELDISVYPRSTMRGKDPPQTTTLHFPQKKSASR